MVWSRGGHLGNIKRCSRSSPGGSHDQSHMSGMMELESVVQGHGTGWVIVWSGSHVARVRSWNRVGVFKDLTCFSDATISTTSK
jgi:hypothetical protein